MKSTRKRRYDKAWFDKEIQASWDEYRKAVDLAWYMRKSRIYLAQVKHAEYLGVS